jgi:hypothetical protein
MLKEVQGPLSCPDRLWGPPNLPSRGYGGALSAEVKRPERDVGLPFPGSSKVKIA